MPCTELKMEATFQGFVQTILDITMDLLRDGRYDCQAISMVYCELSLRRPKSSGFNFECQMTPASSLYLKHILLPNAPFIFY